ncbi:hypothetical protein P3T76_003880 [Phytophthora citrophthora]|uniref:Uncharacterized protein n=1 Tax=Phytophthora citrophthora TaxID=4793 RepID=A0AAD9GV40_9STRA|nr:hypothetical protein P3T76_003880 [Phytophthora citrophthora]
MGLKKAPLLGSSGSVGETGSSVIDGDRNLLSHFGTSSDREIAPLNVTARKSAAIRRNLVARGLARQYSDQKTREEKFKTQVPRYQRQQKILENYQRVQAQRDAEAEPPDRHEDSDDAEDSNENVILVVPRRSNSAPGSAPGQSKRRISPVVPPKKATIFLRHSKMRHLRENQDEEADKHSTTFRLKPSPSESDIPQTQLRPIPRQPTSKSGSETQTLSQNPPTGPAPWLSTARRSSRVVLSELSITKDIMMREQLLRQLKEALVLVDSLLQEFLRSQNELKQAQAALDAAKAMSPSAMKKTGSLIGLTLLSPVDEDFARNAVAEAEVAVTEANSHLADATKRLSHHIRHIGLLIGGLQQSTLSVVEGILDWRQMRQRRRQMSNFQRLFRFPWRRLRISNYLLHLNEDLRSLFPSVSLELLLGPKAVYNPLLLTRSILQSFGTSSAGRTFLTERDCSNTTAASKSPTKASSPDQGKLTGVSSVGLKRLQEFLSSSSPPKPTVDFDRLQRCLEAIYHEEELEALERQRCGEEEHRVETTYDPFSTIKSAGGVEETLTNMMVLQSPTSHLLGEQLRMRQEDTTRAFPEAQSTQKTSSAEAFQINPERLREFLDKRAALLQPVGDCELRDVQKWGLKNKLQGKLMIRKNNEKRVENLLVRKIQLQYLAYRSRNSLQSHLTDFVQRVRNSVVNIQRIFRGHRAKRSYNCIRGAWLEHKRQISAVRTIVNSFRRYRRRQHHRISMTVESIAQAQLITLLANKLNESETEQEAAQRYRRVGEERRRQRIVLLQKHKMEQQEIERKRNAAAVQMQAVVRAHLAQGQAKLLRQEKKAHMTAVSAMAIQSKIRKFLNVQQDRRQRFRKDLERVNQSAVRIQSIYRGYNSRASLFGQLDEQSQQVLNNQFMAHTFEEDETDEDDDDEEEEEQEEEEEEEEGEEFDQMTSIAGSEKDQEDKLPLIIISHSRPSSGKSTSFVDEKTVGRTQTPSNPVSLPPLCPRDGSSSSLLSSTSSSGTGRRISVAMTRVRLKLKDAEIGDKFATPPSRRNSFVGSVRHQT